MRRSEALQGVRMMRFLDILGRYEAAEFGQLEAAELLGVGERTFRRWRQRLRTTAKRACWTGGLAKLRASGFRGMGGGGGGALSRPLCRLHGQAFS